jgi:NAD(P)-dependent dehydrogenase (short-subunit alcohol dehydrogenase family)
MQAQGGGVIVNTASAVAHNGVKNRIAYSASKGAVVSMSRAAAAELLQDNIRVNVVSPGATQSPSLEERINSSPDPAQAYRDFCARQPMGRIATAEEIAKAFLFAADDEIGFMDGITIQVDGGASI